MFNYTCNDFVTVNEHLSSRYLEYDVGIPVIELPIVFHRPGCNLEILENENIIKKIYKTLY